MSVSLLSGRFTGRVLRAWNKPSCWWRLGVWGGDKCSDPVVLLWVWALEISLADVVERWTVGSKVGRPHSFELRRQQDITQASTMVICEQTNLGREGLRSFGTLSPSDWSGVPNLGHSWALHYVGGMLSDGVETGNSKPFCRWSHSARTTATYLHSSVMANYILVASLKPTCRTTSSPLSPPLMMCMPSLCWKAPAYH